MNRAMDPIVPPAVRRLGTFSRPLLLLLVLLGLGLWKCNVSNQPQENLLTLKLDDSLSNYDKIRVDILYPNGTTYKDSVFSGKYVPGPDHAIKDISLGENPPTEYQIVVTGYRSGKRTLVFSIQMGPNGGQPPQILVREPPADTTTPVPVEVLPQRIILSTPTPLTLFSRAPAVAVSAAVEPAAADQGLLYSSSDTAVVRIDAAGSIHPGMAGEADITLRSKRDTGRIANLHVRVLDSVQVRGLTVTPDKYTLYVGGASIRLSAEVAPKEAGITVLFSSNDEKVAKVDPDGTVRPVAAGQADIKVTPAGYPGLSLTARITVLVDPPQLDVGADRMAKLNDTLVFPIKVTQAYGDVASLKWDLDGNGIWDDSTQVPTASPKHIYDGADTLVLARFYVRDTEGNVAVDSVRVHIGRRLAAPEFTKATTPSPTRLSKPTWAWTGHPGGAGTFRISLDGKPETETKALSFTADSLADGDHILTVRELDAAGGMPSDTAGRLIKIVTKGPIVDITSPVAGSLTNANSIGVTWTEKPLTGAPVTHTDLEKLTGKQGAIKIIREASDDYGNKGADTVIVFRDTIPPPAPTFAGQTSPATVNAAYASPVQWVWTRSSPKDSFLVSLNGAAAVKQGGTTYTLANPANQTYVLNVMALDTAGNASAAATFSILVDRTAPPAPKVTGTTPTGAPTWSWGQGTGSDGAKIYRYKLSTAAAYSVETSSTSHSPTGLGTGKYTLLVQERDAAGNWSADGSLAIEVDKTGPSVAVAKPTPMGRVTSVDPVVSGVVTDDHGIKKVEYRINSNAYVPVSFTGGAWSFAASYDVGLSTVWIRGEDQFGNRDSVSIKIYKYPNVVFVRKNATGKGTSWEDAYGELYQALDATKSYQPGTQVWVTKGKYSSAVALDSRLTVPWSNFSILGGFDDKAPSADTSKRDFSYGATSLGSRVYIEKAGEAVKAVTIDGFSIEDLKRDYLGIESREIDENVIIKNIKVRNLLDDNGVLNLYSKFSRLENCEFDSNYWADGVGVSLGAESKMLNCTFVNNGGTGFGAPIFFLSSLDVQGGMFTENFRYEQGEKVVSHFDISAGQRLTINNARIQKGEAGIFRGSPPAGFLTYGTGNIEIK